MIEYEELRLRLLESEKTVKNLKEALNNRELGKEKFAKEIKIAASTLYQILKGNRLPSIDTFCRIVRVLNVSADTLLNKDKGGIAA